MAVTAGSPDGDIAHVGPAVATDIAAAAFTDTAAGGTGCTDGVMAVSVDDNLEDDAATMPDTMINKGIKPEDCTCCCIL